MVCQTTESFSQAGECQDLRHINGTVVIAVQIVEVQEAQIIFISVIEVIDGTLYGYTHIPEAIIRYEKGDKTPTETSPALSEPVALDIETDVISARLFYHGEHSVSTIWRR